MVRFIDEPKCSCGNCIVCDCKKSKEQNREKRRELSREKRREIEREIDRLERASWLR